MLNACPAVVNVSVRPKDQVDRELVAALQGIRPIELTGVSFTYVSERLAMKTDLRHMFLKGYLMAQSFNLAVTSGRAKYKMNALKAKMYRNPKPSTKLAKLMKVVDVARFTREEVWLIVEMCNEYPAKRFGPANIYNNLSLEADDLVLLCDDGFQQGDDPGYGSPERLWNNIVNIALKFDVRGILRSVNRWSGEESFPLVYPLSYSIDLAVKSPYAINPAVTGYSEYFATSKCLVADLLLSQMMILSFFNVIEDLGGLGSVCVPTGTAKTDALFNSILRNNGLKSEDERENCIYQEWKAIRNCDMVVSFGGKLKDVAVGMTDYLRERGGDFLRPQLLFALPFSIRRNTTWATIRGRKIPDFYEFTDSREERLQKIRLIKAYSWVMGINDQLPKLGLSALAMRFEDMLTIKEMGFMELAGGRYTLCLVGHTMKSEMTPRIDEIGLSSEHFYTTNFPLTRCSIKFDGRGEAALVVEPHQLNF